MNSDATGVAGFRQESAASVRAEAAALGISKSTAHRRRQTSQAEQIRQLQETVAALEASRAQPQPAQSAQPPRPRPAFGLRPVALPKAVVAARVAPAPVSLPVARQPEPEPEIQMPVAEPLVQTVIRSEGRRRLVGREASSVVRKVLVITDTHCRPETLPRVRRVMKMIGLYAAVLQPDDVVHGGDGNDNESVCPHIGNGTLRGRRKPSIQKCFGAFRDAMKTLTDTLDEGGVTKRRHYCYGNHDVWPAEFEDEHPELEGIITGLYSSIFRDMGWTTSAYGERFYLGGVAYTHAVLSKKSQAVSGLDTEKMIGRDADCDMVVGHTHQQADITRDNRHGKRVRIVNAGSSMPQDWVPDWAEYTQAAEIDYGVRVVLDCDGHIRSTRWITMAQLEERYGAEADRILAEGGVR
jgi:predicted phosphodiesterase